MKTNLYVFFAFVVIAGIFSAGMSAQDTKATSAKTVDAKSIFLGNKCNGCHSIEAAGIVKKGGASTSKTGPPDLSTVGAKTDTKMLTGFLQKKQDIGGKKHPIKFAGTPAQLDSLTQWLTSMKSAGSMKMKK